MAEVIRHHHCREKGDDQLVSKQISSVGEFLGTNDLFPCQKITLFIRLKPQFKKISSAPSIGNKTLFGTRLPSQ
jgi:hypothetical protein